jgi:hypothetical protein
MSNIFTPRPVGSVPNGIERLDHDPARLHLSMTDADKNRRQLDPDQRFVFVDQNSGDQFLYMGRADCGSGCRCAAEAVWIGR